ncbi:TIGR03986 family CRISPR-associated RAMP protein [uncultured Selenomonas sp.]|uniref:TIGR03986 family type III CRISPR-associated RAMP protein n=1 Tax=uncultured Selenomonas sp. TaxID=159275 RepID=UPI0026137CD2|nr:TIGR03986 family CRISPR-associated RAMP protein [uncultured Selenomonas sp.]
MADDWREKLAKKFGRDVPEEKEEKKDWGAAYEKAESRRPRRSGERRGGYGGGRGNQGGGYGRQGGGASPRPKTTEPASAPYNFVSLPEAIVPAPLDQGLDWHKMEEKERLRRYRDYVCADGAKSGRIELSLETLTPLFIGSGSSGDTNEFFSPTGEPIVPGSTLRGFIKHMVRMVSGGAMRPGAEFTERHLYSRALADSLASFRDYYKERMVENITVSKKTDDGRTIEVAKSVSKANAGFLIAVQGKYYVCPADKESLKIPRGEEQNRAEIRWHHKEQSADVITGRSPQKKYIYFRISKADWSKERRLPVPESVLKGYREDKSRGRFDLLANGLKRREAAGFTHDAEISFCAPCFYMAEDGVVQHFGHGRYYRIPYEKSIADHVPAALQKDTIDFADAIFGCKALWAGRVIFEDAVLQGTAKQLAPSRSHPLMTPNPTSFQLYLEQTGKEPQHWDSATPIRGYKLYWHQKASADSWRLDPERDKVVKGTQEIRPIAAGARFSGSIRFKNLRPEELGALLEVFSLSESGEDICFKIGQGKSLGLGSVRLKARLLLEDTEKQFAGLFTDGAWRESLEENTGEECLAAFRRWREEHLGEGKEAFEKSMKELRCLLDWNKTNLPKWQEKTAMMPLGDTRFKERVILKSALDFAR